MVCLQCLAVLCERFRSLVRCVCTPKQESRVSRGALSVKRQPREYVCPLVSASQIHNVGVQVVARAWMSDVVEGFAVTSAEVIPPLHQVTLMPSSICISLPTAHRQAISSFYCTCISGTTDHSSPALKTISLPNQSFD